MTIPCLTFVRIVTAGGPYRPGDVVAAAFCEPTVARLLIHGEDGATEAAEGAPSVVATTIPDSVSATVLVASEPYRTGDLVTLSFVDPSVARIHRSAFTPPARERGPRERHPNVEPLSFAERAEPAAVATIAAPTVAPPPIAALPSPASLAAAAEVAAPFARAPAARAEATLPAPPALAESPAAREVPVTDHLLRLEWSAERAGRFVQVVDKLFTVDRLGWYRHVLATRLLVADGVDCRGETHPPATETLRILRSGGLEALGAPLLAAYLPGFAVTSDWLATLHGSVLPAALERLCEELDGSLSDDGAGVAPRRGLLVGAVSRRSLVAPYRAGTTVEAMLPRLVPDVAVDPGVSDALGRYRETLLELFDQIAPAPDAVRVRQMAQPNAVLDDRLWHLVGAVQTSLVAGEAAAGA